MSNKLLYLYVSFFTVTAMMIRLAFIDGETFSVLFDNEYPHSNIFSIVFSWFFGYLKESYIHFISNGDYFFRFMAVLFFFRFALIPLDLLIDIKQRKKDKLSDEVSEIKSRVSGLTERSEELRKLYKHYEIKPMLNVSLMLIKLAFIIGLFVVLKNGFGYEPDFAVDNNSVVNAVLGLFLFPIVFLSSKTETSYRSSIYYALGLPVLLYILGLTIFSVSLFSFIVFMQASNYAVTLLLEQHSKANIFQLAELYENKQ